METSKPPSPLCTVVVVVAAVIGLAPNKVLPGAGPNKEAINKLQVFYYYNNMFLFRTKRCKIYVLLVVAVPKVKLPVAVVLDGPPNVNMFVVVGVPKLSPVNKGADVVGVENKLGAVVIVVSVLDPRSRPLLCVWAVVVGVPNPKLRPTDVVGVDIVPNVNGLDVVAAVPNDVLPKPKLVIDLNKKKRLIIE